MMVWKKVAPFKYGIIWPCLVSMLNLWGVYIYVYIYMTPHVRSVSCVVVVSCYLGSAFGLESKPPTKTNQISI